ncbi:MAG: DUF58 domain-containing protein, partial [Chloroflexi bacterium]|nr:DUF58 domain-containing protein [Chloroflexota bacterium]
MRGARWWVLLVLLALAGVITRQGVLLSLALTLGVATGVSHLWERFGLSGVSYERRLAADHLFPGEETALTVTVTNLKPLPLPWLVVRDRMPQGATLLSGTTEVGVARSESSLLTSLPMSWYQRVVRTHCLRGDRRGWYRIGPAELETGDVFGFGRTRRRDETTQQLVVYPRIRSLETLGLPADRPMVEWLGLRRLVQDPLRFATVRDYAPGDSPRHIHWKATARARSLQTKVFDPGASLSLTLAVDVQTTDHLYE